MSLASVSRRVGDLGQLALARIRSGAPRRVFTFTGGLGDHLACTVAFRELRKRGARNLWMASPWPELFLGNADIDAVVPPLVAHSRFVRASAGCAVPLDYSHYIAERDIDAPTDRHILAVICQRAGVTGEVALRPRFTLRDDERAAGRRFPSQICIQSSGRGAAAFMENKEWFADRFQSVADALASRFSLIQIGSVESPRLDRTLDLRGKTSLRETAALLSCSRLFIGQVGFLMHLARAVECRAAILFGGRETPALTGYTANENLCTPLPCSPCWQRSRCDFNHDCMKQISVEAVLASVEKQLAQTGALPEETATL